MVKHAVFHACRLNKHELCARKLKGAAMRFERSAPVWHCSCDCHKDKDNAISR